MESQLFVDIKLPLNNIVLDVTLEIPTSGVCVIFGISGSGKTSLLRCIAGLEDTCTGKIQFLGQTWLSDAQRIPTYQRSLAYVFQESSLFQHLSVKGNLEFAIKRSNKSLPTSLSFDEVLEVLKLTDLLHRYPNTLSGGERQRVAIGRALLVKPKLLLMDEPLASLDEHHKKEILPLIERLKSDLNIPIIYVSHSVNEVLRLADHMVVLDEGRVVNNGRAIDVLSELNTHMFVGDDLGVVVEGSVAEIDNQWGLASINIGGGLLWLRNQSYALGDQLRLRILAKDISVSLNKRDDTSILNTIAVTVSGVKSDEHNQGFSLVSLTLANGGRRLIARITTRSVFHLQLTKDQSVWAQIKSVALISSSPENHPL